MFHPTSEGNKNDKNHIFIFGRYDLCASSCANYFSIAAQNFSRLWHDDSRLITAAVAVNLGPFIVLLLISAVWPHPVKYTQLFALFSCGASLSWEECLPYQTVNLPVRMDISAAGRENNKASKAVSLFRSLWSASGTVVSLRGHTAHQSVCLPRCSRWAMVICRCPKICAERMKISDKVVYSFRWVVVCRIFFFFALWKKLLLHSTVSLRSIKVICLVLLTCSQFWINILFASVEQLCRLWWNNYFFSSV